MGLLGECYCVSLMVRKWDLEVHGGRWETGDPEVVDVIPVKVLLLESAGEIVHKRQEVSAHRSPMEGPCHRIYASGGRVSLRVLHFRVVDVDVSDPQPSAIALQEPCCPRSSRKGYEPSWLQAKPSIHSSEPTYIREFSLGKWPR